MPAPQPTAWMHSHSADTASEVASNGSSSFIRCDTVFRNDPSVRCRAARTLVNSPRHGPWRSMAAAACARTAAW